MEASSELKTVTTLRCPNGSVVYVVGTAHFSKESVEDVRRTIRDKRPNYVVLELCRDRQLMLTYSEENILREARTMDMAKVRAFIRRDGFVVGVTQSLLLKVTAELTRKLGVAPGGEFRAGFEEGRRMGCRVILGDRQVGVTFRRALSALSFWQKLRFAFSLAELMTTGVNITAEEVEEMKNKDILSVMTGQLSKQFPALADVLVEERDKILTHALMSAANCGQLPYGAPVRVVGVLGMGHVAGVEKHWMQPLDVRDLLTLPPPSRRSSTVVLGLKIGALGLVGVAAFIIVRKLWF